MAGRGNPSVDHIVDPSTLGFHSNTLYKVLFTKYMFFRRGSDSTLPTAPRHLDGHHFYSIAACNTTNPGSVSRLSKMGAVLIFQMGVFFRTCILDDNMTILHRCFTAEFDGLSPLWYEKRRFTHDKTVYLGSLQFRRKKRSASAYRAKQHSNGCGGRHKAVFLCINSLGVFLMLIWAHGNN